MIPLTTLWIPILLSAVLVFIASNILHMAIPGWHRGDYGKLPDEAAVLSGLTSAKTGQYIAPNMDWRKTPKEAAISLQWSGTASSTIRCSANRPDIATNSVSSFRGSPKG